MPTPNAPDAALTARLAADIVALGADGRFGVAVSGGPDSLALLLLAARAFSQRVEAATVDHGLRAGSADEARFVESICRDLDVSHTTLTLPPLPAGNLQARARIARYAALEAWRARRGLDWLLTAHHADDQLETVIMRLNRGAGVGGLAGIRARQGRVLRPLLGWRRAELAAIVMAAGLTPIDDPSNRDDRFDRARLRRALADADWLDPLAVAASAAHLADADAALDWDGAGQAPPEIVRRRVRRAIAAIDPDARPRGAQLTRLIATLERGGTATLGKVRCTGGAEWRFAPAPPRREIA